MRKIMATLDIGNSCTKLVVGEMTKDKFNILSISECNTLGLKKNNIISLKDLKESIIKVFKDSEDKLNLPIKKVIVTIPSYDTEFSIGEAKIKVNEKVTTHDITKVILESYKGIIPDNMELINATPMHFKLDNGDITLNPKNLETKSLAVKTVLIMAPKNSVYKFLSVLDELNIDIVDICVDSIGDYYTFKNNKLDKQRTAIINIGASKTTISTFNKGILTNISNIDLGANNVDNDIAYIYKIPVENAKKLKEDYISAVPKSTEKEDYTTVKDKNNKEIKVNLNELSKVVYSRLKEILESSKKELSHLTKKEVSNIIFTGGITNMRDFNLVIESIFGKEATLGEIKTIGARNNKFSSAIGLIKWYNSIATLKNKDYSIFTIEEQEEFSKLDKQELEENNSVIDKFFSYFLDN